jgi:hypothetical protein
VNSPTGYFDLKSTFAILDVGKEFVVSRNMFGHATVNKPIKGVGVLTKI